MLPAADGAETCVVVTRRDVGRFIDVSLEGLVAESGDTLVDRHTRWLGEAFARFER